MRRRRHGRISGMKRSFLGLLAPFLPFQGGQLHREPGHADAARGDEHGAQPAGGFAAAGEPLFKVLCGSFKSSHGTVLLPRL